MTTLLKHGICRGEIEGTARMVGMEQTDGLCEACLPPSGIGSRGILAKSTLE